MWLGYISKEARTQRREAILDENEYYEATEGILHDAGIAEEAQVSFFTILHFKRV